MSACLYLIAAWGLFEFNRMAARTAPGAVKVAGHILSFLAFACAFAGRIHLLLAVIVLWALIPMMLVTFTAPPPSPRSTSDIGKAVLGPVYVSLPLALLTVMDRYPQGNVWIFFLLVVIFSGDTGAFYCGKYLGRHKLYEAVSPNKTWEGAFGGFLFSVIAALWFLHLWPIHAADWRALLLVALLSLSGQVGDLAESMLKRSHGTKDASGLLPGHGGILDRIDGILFSIPVLYIYLTLRI
jgi:phosphatidate cytidylyltransferase